VPGAKLPVQVPGQLMPVGVLITEPDPAPAKATVNTSPVVKFAVIFVAAVIVTLQVVPEQPPLQPLKYPPLPGVSVRVICVPLAKFALQVVGQLMPAGELVTVPDPTAATVRPYSAVKEGFTLSAASMVMVQVLVPEQLPLQPAKT
jgi:phage tail protein X